MIKPKKTAWYVIIPLKTSQILDMKLHRLSDSYVRVQPVDETVNLLDKFKPTAQASVHKHNISGNIKQAITTYSVSLFQWHT